jgi:hypothetical protein
MIAWLRDLWQEWRIYGATIDPNSKCPACGHRNGKLKCVTVEKKEKPNATVMVQHECRVCHAAWYEPTVLKPEKWVPAELLRDTAAPRTS